MQLLRKRCDAVLMGAETLRTYRGPLLVHGQKKQPLNVVISSMLAGISPRWDFFTTPRVQRVLFVNSGVSRAKLRAFERSSEVVMLKRGTPAAAQIVQELGARGVRRLLVEGGGGVMWDFASQGLIDEYNVTLTPKIVGGVKAPTLVDGEGFEPREVLKLKLKSCRKVGDELYLIYQKNL